MGPVRVVKIEALYRITRSRRDFWIRDGCCSAYIMKIRITYYGIKILRYLLILSEHTNEFFTSVQ